MRVPEFDSSVTHSIGLEVDGVVIENIIEVSGLKMEQVVIELREGTAEGGHSIKKLPGGWKAGEFTLTRALSQDDSFDKWIKNLQLGATDDIRKNGSVIVFDAEGQEIKRYKFSNAWPKSLEIGTLEAGDTGVLTEKLVLTYEGLEVG
jgi:phage tail-like protein